MSDIDRLMITLSEARAAVDVLRMDMQKLTDSVITDEQRAEIAAIEAEFEAAMEAAGKELAKAEKAVKTAILDLGKSYKCPGAHLQAVYGKPRVRWDTKAIDGYAINHPELFAFRTEGKPSVSIRLMK